MGGTILLVDNYYPHFKWMRPALKRRGFSVFHAKSPDEGLALFHMHQPYIDMTVIDMIKPAPINLNMADAVARMRPGLPVLYLMGSPSALEGGPLEDDGSASVLANPFTEEEFLARVEDILETETIAGHTPDEELWQRLIMGSDQISAGATMVYIYEFSQAALAAGHVTMLLAGNIRCAFRPTNYDAAPYSVIVRSGDATRARRIISQAWVGRSFNSAAWGAAVE